MSSLSGLEKLETDTIATGATLLPEGQTEEDAVAIYNNYDFNHQYDSKLSITKYREQVGINIDILTAFVLLYSELHKVLTRNLNT